MSTGWQQQPIEVEGRKFRLGEVSGGKLYHGSLTKLAPGSTLTAQPQARNFKESMGDRVSVTSDKGRALYWADEARARAKLLTPVFVYEVTPVGEVAPWRVGLTDQGKSFVLWEGHCLEAVITQLVL